MAESDSMTSWTMLNICACSVPIEGVLSMSQSRSSAGVFKVSPTATERTGRHLVADRVVGARQL